MEETTKQSLNLLMGLICTLGLGEIVLLAVGVANYVRIGSLTRWLDGQSRSADSLEARLRTLEARVAGCPQCHAALVRVGE